ncbi:hypothetical protein IV203_029718 [Nitzschia inconspicua]|uniref:Uncharacterized protein n=1 Tax=Nitzschia inconspicua TaxID=303405 RepID=A0A9K3Q102_9STRA|nr:hypothetical protein IV203_029718 [Nitzschia inconspicua]
MKGSLEEEISYSILATTAPSSPLSSLPEASVVNDESLGEEAKPQSDLNDTQILMPQQSTTQSEEPSSNVVPTAQRPRRKRIVLQESTFSSTTPDRTIRKQSPTQQFRTMLKPKPNFNPSTASATSPASGGQRNYFIVNDEMGRPISPAPTPAPKGLFEVRDEMGQIIRPPAPPSKVVATNPSTTCTDSAANLQHVHDDDDKGTTVAPPPPKTVPRSGLSKFTETQQLFKVSGISDFGVSNEILQLSGRSNRRQMVWKDVNKNVPAGRYDADEEPIRVTKDSLGTSPTVAASTKFSSLSDPALSPTPTTETGSDPLPNASKDLSSTPKDESVLFVVRDEMGKQIDPAPTAAPKGLFEVRDEMGNAIDPPPVKQRQRVPSSIPKSGLSKFTATKELFKVSGMTEFAIPSEMHQI